MASSEPHSDRRRLGLVIVDYRSFADTRRAVASVLAGTWAPDRIVIVDNAGGIAATEVAALSPVATLISAPDNGGFARGVNLGVSALLQDGCTHLLVLNPDAELDPAATERLAAALDADPQLALVGPLIFEDAARTEPWFAGSDVQWAVGRMTHRRRLPAEGDRANATLPQPFITGCCWLIAAAAWQRLGPLSEAYFLYFEDTDFCQRAQRQGYRLGLVPGAVAIHRPSTTVGKHSPLYRYQFARNRIWFMRRWAPRPMLASFLAFTLAIKVPAAFLVFGIKDRDLPALRAFLQGTWHGLTRAPDATLRLG